MHTVPDCQRATPFKLGGRDTDTIILDGAGTACKVDAHRDAAGTCVQSVLGQLQHHVHQPGDGRRRLEPRGDI